MSESKKEELDQEGVIPTLKEAKETVPTIGAQPSSLPVPVPPSGSVPLQPPPDAASFNTRRTKLHEVANETWGLPWIPDDIYAHIIRYANPDHAKKTEEGFKLPLLEGGTILFKRDERGNESIEGPENFKLHHAQAMVALAKMRGWKTINVEGTTPQMERMWLAVQLQNLTDKELFIQKQEAGIIPKTDKDGKAVEFVAPITVGNFEPLADSRALKIFLEAEARFNARHPVKQALAEPEIPPSIKESQFITGPKEDKPETPPATPTTGASETKNSQFIGPLKEEKPASAPDAATPKPKEPETVADSPRNTVRKPNAPRR